MREAKFNFILRQRPAQAVLKGASKEKPEKNLDFFEL